MELTNLSKIRTLMAEAGIGFRKEYGQNFLTSAAVVSRIAEAAADTPDTFVLEIGPGIGTLTRELGALYRRVTAIEIDTGLAPVLERTLSDLPNVNVIFGDVMKTDLSELIRRESCGLPLAVCANLPYYITTPILWRLLESRIPFSSITVMVQSEVADRLVAAPGSADYGAITAALGYYGTPRRLFTVPAGDFVPAPKVNSAVVRIDLYRQPLYHPKSETCFFKTVKAAFGQRRKTLVNALSSAFPTLSKETLSEILLSAGLDEKVRGERLSTADFAAISDLIFEKSK